MPTGSITIYYAPAGSTTLIPLTTVPASAAFSTGGASFTYASPATPGNYSIYAGYSGDSNYAAVTTAGSPLNVLVAIATTTTVTTPATAPVNGLFSVNIKLTSVTSTQTPTGTINVTARLAGSSTSTNIGIVNASGTYSSSGSSFNASLPAAGVWTITASFYGDAYFSPSTGTSTITVNPATAVATTLRITAPANVAVSTPYTAVVALTAASTLTSGPSGLVTLVVTSPTGAIVSTFNTTAASAYLGSGYSASIPAATTAGTYTLTASYAGDANYAASSITSTVVVGSTLNTTSIGISGPTNVVQNVPSSVTIHLIPQTGVTAIPTGNVVITSVNPSGVTATLGTITAAQALASGGDVATINYSILGTFTVTATYSGDANFSGSSGSLVITVTTGTPASFTFTADDPTLTATSVPIQIPSSSNVTVPLTAVAVNGSPGPLSLSVTTSLTSGSVDFNMPNMYFVDSTGAILPTVGGFQQITPVAAGTHLGLLIRGTNLQSMRRTDPLSPSRTAPTVCLLVGLFVLAGKKRKQWSGRCARLLCSLLLAIVSGSAMTGCYPVGGNIFNVQVKAAPAGAATLANTQLVTFQVQYSQ